MLKENYIYSLSKVDDFEVKPTTIGIDIIKNGFQKHIKKEEKKTSTPIKISIAALIISSIVPLISLYKIIKPNESANNGYNQSYDRNNQTDSIVKNIVSDSLFIEKIKNSIKHDSVFLKELNNK